jgi:hypothetical protein
MTTLSADDVFNAIFIDEKARLDAKANEIANASTGQKRVIQLNESYRKRTAAYTKAVVAIVVALSIVVILKVVQEYNTNPEVVLTLVYILLLSLSILYAASVAFEVVNRDKTNYDRLDVPPPIIPTDYDNERDQNKAAGIGDLLGTLPGMCIGAKCCDLTASVYNSENAKCCPFSTPFVVDGKCSTGTISSFLDVNTGQEITSCDGRPKGDSSSGYEKICMNNQ